MSSRFASLLTEQRNPRSTNIDALPLEEILRVIHEEDRTVLDAVKAALPQIARAVELVEARLRQGGRLFYLGAGTSGRLGVLDASECPPTFQVPPDLVQGIIAGGDVALRRAVEACEDDPEAGAQDLQRHGFTPADVVLGIAASGRTPYVVGGVRWAGRIGAGTIGLSCTPHAELSHVAEVAIEVLTGPEVVTGSTRMKAGTATKLVLNMLSTTVMIRLGYVYGNLMVNVEPRNEKLRDRAARITSELTGVSYETAAAAVQAGGGVRQAVLMLKLGLSREQAEERLRLAGGNLRRALDLQVGS